MNSQDNNAMINITITRPFDSHRVPRGILVMLDGAEVARLERGDSVTIETNEGDHLLAASGLFLKAARKTISISQNCSFYVCVDLYHQKQFHIATNGLFLWKLPIGIYDTEEDMFGIQMKEETPLFFSSKSYQVGIFVLSLVPGIFLFLTKCNILVSFLMLLVVLLPFLTIPTAKGLVKEGFLAGGLIIGVILFFSYLNPWQRAVIYAVAFILIGLQITKIVVSKRTRS